MAALLDCRLQRLHTCKRNEISERNDSAYGGCIAHSDCDHRCHAAGGGTWRKCLKKHLKILTIINSRTDEIFAPQAETMNAELAVMHHRFIEKYQLVPVPSVAGDGKISWIKLLDAE